MFKDSLSNNTQVFKGDIAYVYQYQKRKEIEFFSDLDKIQVSEIIPKAKVTDTVMLEGFSINNKKGNIEKDKILGILTYLREGDIIKTSEGDKIINFFIKENNPIPCLRKIKEEYEYCKLFAIFQLDKKIEIKICPYDLICLNQDNLCELIKLTKIQYPRLYNGYISYLLNGKEKNINIFDIYINNKKYENKEAIKEIFDWACNNKNSINDATYNFQKIFSLKLTNFEMLNVKLI